jgi:hypothetical protein
VLVYPEYLIKTVLTIRKMSGENLPVTDSTHCIYKAIVCARSNDNNHIVEESDNLYALAKNVE